MGRINVWLPADLHQTLQTQLGHVNVSQLLQTAIRDVLGCRHDDLACARCAAPIDRHELVDAALSDFYQAAMWRLGDLVGECGTAEGAARVLKDVGQRWQISAADRVPVPRPTRRQRQVAIDLKEFPAVPSTKEIT